MRMIALAIVALLVTPAFADAQDEQRAQLTRFRAEARVFTDGKGHYLATLVEDRERLLVLYGDATSLTRLRHVGLSLHKDTQEIVFEYKDPRTERTAGFNRIVVSGREAKVSCAKRVATFASVPDADSRKLLAKATLSAEPRWDRQPYVLARDEGTTYFYVDRSTSPAREKDFHVYTGKRGRLKLLKVTDLVEDTAGSVYVTPQGTLRFTLGGEAQRRTNVSGTWTPARKKTRMPLVIVPLEDKLVYTDLAIYLDKRIGTPCDDI